MEQVPYETRTLSLDGIIIDQDVQPRDELHTHRVDEYAEYYRDGADMPPIKVHEVDGRLYLCDGFHRYAAACRAGMNSIECRVRNSSTRGALMVDAMRSNAKHGQPLTYTERIRACKRLIKIFAEDDRKWTQKEIAEITGTSQATVSRLLKELKPELNPQELYINPDATGVSPYESEQYAKVMAKHYESRGQIEEDEVVAEVRAKIAEAAEHCNLIFQAARKISESLHLLKSLEGGEEVRSRMGLLEQAKNDILMIRTLTPKDVCKHCNGRGCRKCYERGWLSIGREKEV
jgi:transcriptional regulator with XRE-family HTH domain